MKFKKAHIIKNLVALGKTKEAISILVSKSKKLSADFQKEILLLSNRFYRLIQGKQREVIENVDVKYNRIIDALLYLIDEYIFLKIKLVA